MLKLPLLIIYAFVTGSSYEPGQFSRKKVKIDSPIRNAIKLEDGWVRLIGQIGFMLLLFLIYLILVGGTEILLLGASNF